MFNFILQIGILLCIGGLLIIAIHSKSVQSFLILLSSVLITAVGYIVTRFSIIEINWLTFDNVYLFVTIPVSVVGLILLMKDTFSGKNISSDGDEEIEINNELLISEDNK